MRVRVFRDADHLAESAAEEIAAWLRVDSDLPTVGLAGGETPRATYEQLRRIRLPWDQIHVWMTDERFLPPDHTDNNGRMAREALLDHIPANFYEVPYLSDDPAGSAAAYEEMLAGFLPVGSGGIQPGLVLLGIGEDGHTASLFPGSDALGVERRGFVANWAGDLGWRLTSTVPLLSAARRTMFIVSGSRKASIVAEILADGSDDHPAALVTRQARDPVWLLDRSAAAKLSFD
jgi:6-phosphogluconolactonase